MEYFVMLGKTKAGPYSIEEMREKNLLRPEVMISAQGSGEWLKVKDMPELLVASQEKAAVSKPADMPSEEKEYPKSWVFEAILAILFFFPFGLVAFIYALKVEPAFNKGNADQAKIFSLKARNWAIASYITGICVSWIIKGIV